MYDVGPAEYPIHKNYAVTIAGETYDVRAIVHHHKTRSLLSKETENQKWLRHPVTNKKLAPQEVRLIKQICIRNLLADKILINEDGTIEIRSRLQGTPYERLANIEDVQQFAAAANAMAGNVNMLNVQNESSGIQLIILHLNSNDLARIATMLSLLNHAQNNQTNDEDADSAESEEIDADDIVRALNNHRTEDNISVAAPAPATLPSMPHHSSQLQRSATLLAESMQTMLNAASPAPATENNQQQSPQHPRPN